MDALDDIRTDAFEFLTGATTTALEAGLDQAPRPFLPFLIEEAEEAQALVGELFDLAAAENPLTKVLERVKEVEHQELAKYALTVFIAHHEEGRKLTLPTYFERHPEALDALMAKAENAAFTTGASGEEKLAWFREDAFQNEHHEHWHIVYPFAGVGTPGKLKDRQGELFLTMHQQMLARYNTERRSAGLPKTVPLADYGAVIHEGYDSGLPNYTPRPNDQRMTETYRIWRNHEEYRDFTREGNEQARDRLKVAIDESRFARARGGPRPLSADLFGATLESSIDSATPREPNGELGFYGNLHNDGHMLTSAIGVPQMPQPEPGTRPEFPKFGVMSSTIVAIMDPVFFRWHQHVDDLHFAMQEKLPPNDFSDAPKVRVEARDIFLVFRDQLPVFDDDAQAEAWAQSTYGGDAGDRDLDQTSTPVLETYFETRTFTPERGTRDPVELTYLQHREFVYALRVVNEENRPQIVTARIWLVSSAHAEDRRMWIEMDTFEVELAAGQTRYVVRPAARSSVIKKRNGVGPRPPILLTTPGTGDPNPNDKNYCDCGWPYSLLLPKGTQEGEEFQLMVMFSGKDLDMQGVKPDCGGDRMCGTKAAKYPDRREMGYPFSRRFPAGKSITQTIDEAPNMARRTLRIRQRPNEA